MKKIGVATALVAISALMTAQSALAEPTPSPTPSVSAEEPEEDPGPPPEPFLISPAVLDALDNWQASKQRAVKLATKADRKQVRAANKVDATVTANGDATSLQSELEDFARASYMYGSPSASQLILNSNEQNIADVIHGFKYIENVSVDKGIATASALEQARAQQDIYAAATADSLISRLAAIVATADIDAANRKIFRTAANDGPTSLTAITAIASMDETGCPSRAPAEAIIGITPNADIYAICQEAIAQARTPQAKAAISWAFAHLGSPYACQGVGRMNVFQFDCSSYVSRAYEEGAGIVTSVNGWAPTTHTMLPTTHPNFRPIASDEISAGDLTLYYTCPEGETCTYNHVVMYLGVIDGVPLQLHTNNCGGVSNITPFWGTEDSDKGAYLGARTVVPSSEKWEPPITVGADGDIEVPLFG